MLGIIWSSVSLLDGLPALVCGKCSRSRSVLVFGLMRVLRNSCIPSWLTYSNGNWHQCKLRPPFYHLWKIYCSLLWLCALTTHWSYKARPTSPHYVHLYTIRPHALCSSELFVVCVLMSSPLQPKWATPTCSSPSPPLTPSPTPCHSIPLPVPISLFILSCTCSSLLLPP